MPSRLSSLLVRDGLVGVKRMEKAFQRQVIYGGTLDTILLEMNLVPEERLLQYLSLATGVPPATRGETDVFDAAAVRVCPREVAAEFQIAPLSFDGETLRVVVKEPVNFRQLEQLADELELPIQPLVVPEYRFHVVSDRAYGQTTKARFASLANRSRDVASTVPVGKPATVIVNAARGAEPPDDDEAEAEPPQDAEVVDVALPPSTAGAAGLDVPTRPTAPPAAAHAAAIPEPVTDRGSEEPTAPQTAAARRPDAADPDDASRDAVKTASPGAVTDKRPTVLPPDDADVPPSLRDDAPAPPSLRDDAPAPPPPSIAPIGTDEAEALLTGAGTRDEVFLALLRAIRARAWYAGLLTVQGNDARGRLAIAGSTLDAETIGQVDIELDRASPFQTAVRTASPYIGPLACGDAAIDGMTRRLGGVMPPAALLLPIALRNRVVALAIGHRGADAISISEVASLLPLAGATADAIERLILEAKQRGARLSTVPGELAPHLADAARAALAAAEPAPEPPRHPEPAAAPEPAAEAEAEPPGRPEPAAVAPTPADEPEPAAAPASVGGWSPNPQALATPRLASEPSPAAAPPTEASAAAPPQRTPEQLLAAIEAEHDPAAVAEGIARHRELLPLLRLHFPGRLTLDRYALGGRPMRAEQSGPMLAFLVRLGVNAIDLLTEKMRDEHRDVRYYATLCMSELRPRQSLRDLVERVFDVDYGVRGAALAGLSGYPPRELEPALEPVRRALRATDAARIEAAAAAIGDLADVRAIPDLIDAMTDAGKHADAIREALSRITKQDFGTSVRKWRGWYSKNHDRTRVEWLIDALSHKSAIMRQGAAEELRRVTGEYFGYHHDLPRREREEARRAWTRWWSEAGRQRFRGTDNAAS